ncbi:MAG: ABC transporter permease, partial [bacterium]
MLKNYLKIALRNFWRHKGYTLINCLGLAIGISCCLIALLYIGHEVSYDRFHEHSDRIYRLYSMQRRADGVRYSAGMSMPIGPAVAAEIPGCERVARLISGNGTLQYRDRTLTESIRFTDPDFFRIFSFPLREGDASTALQEMNSVVLSEETARKYFGDADAIGKRLSIRLHEDFEDFIVTGVAAPVPKTSSIDFKVLLRFEKNPRYESSKDNWTDFNHSVYVRLAQGVDPVEVERLLMPFSEMHLANFINYLGRFVDVAPETGEVFRLSLQPISEIHFDTRIHQGRSRSPVYIFVLAIIALMVLGSACINFINLSVARAMTRMKEVGIRKVAGANRKQLLVQFWIETMLLSFLALAIGMVFCEQALPYFNRFTRLQLTMDFFASPYMLAALLGLLLLTVLIAGTYPVLYISRYRPVEIFSGQMRLGRTSYFRQGLVVFQFGLSILFIISALVMSDQLVFLRSQNPGFNEEQVVVIPVMGQKDGAKLLQLFKIKLSTESGVASVTGASNNLGIGPEGSTFRSVSSFEYKGRQVNAHLLRIDPAYLRTLTISVVEGRAFREAVPGDRASILVNETLAAKLSETASVVGLPLT